MMTDSTLLSFAAMSATLSSSSSSSDDDDKKQKDLDVVVSDDDDEGEGSDTVIVRKEDLERYKDLCEQIRNIEVKHAESVFNRRKDTLQEKADYYTELAEELDSAKDHLLYVMNAIEEQDPEFDFEVGKSCLQVE
jgi:hypothetical protein